MTQIFLFINCLFKTWREEKFDHKFMMNLTLSVNCLEHLENISNKYNLGTFQNINIYKNIYLEDLS